MIKYGDLGFVNGRLMLKKAYEGGYAVPAYNFNNMEQIQAIVIACLESQSPVLVQVSAGARNYADPDLLRNMARGALEMMKRMAGELGLREIPMALHLDHGASFEICRDCIENGFSSVMIDGSSLDYGKNIELTRRVSDFAHRWDVTVEGELGVLSGVEDEARSEISSYTRPEDVEHFVAETGVDSLAISIGTSHGAYKFNVRDEKEIPTLRFDLLEEIARRLPGFPIVLHGASSIPQELVRRINECGGRLERAFGIPEEQLRRAATMAVCKINVDSDGRLAMTASVREFLWNNPDRFDPRDYLGKARQSLVDMYMDKNRNVFGSAGRA
ncbi:MAG: class II fructose-1,6-bisphosphate aldolase [Rickettsiales bacterium]|jgi:fructose-bisphosphate aldolase class II|nr:class II fructose-1,6-bisphosphate aldolase [Rickettsiales bacterium]